MTKRMTIIELHKENMKFSSAHFTIFGPNDREPVHGHNYNVYVALHNEVIENGLSYDYRYYKKIITDLCKKLTMSFLLPLHSEHLVIEEDNTHYHIKFYEDSMSLMKKDVTPLPICNISVEELSNWFLQKLTENKDELKKHYIEAIDVKVFTGPGQSGSSHWRADVAATC